MLEFLINFGNYCNFPMVKTFWPFLTIFDHCPKLSFPNTGHQHPNICHCVCFCHVNVSLWVKGNCVRYPSFLSFSFSTSCCSSLSDILPAVHSLHGHSSFIWVKSTLFFSFSSHSQLVTNKGKLRKKNNFLSEKGKVISFTSSECLLERILRVGWILQEMHSCAEKLVNVYVGDTAMNKYKLLERKE